MKHSRIAVVLACCLASSVGLSSATGCRGRTARAGEKDPAIESGSGANVERGHVHFLIPGAPGGGWDGTARGAGEALVRSGLATSVSYENLSGGGGGRALAHFIATAERQERTLLVSSTPIVIASLRSGRGGYHTLRSLVFGAEDGASGRAHSWRDVEPVASVIGDYLTFAVGADSPIESWPDLVARFRGDPAAVKVAGGSVLGGMDHLVTSLAIEAAGGNPRELRYVPYDTGGKARAALFAGETPVLATGVGEILDARRAGLVRLLAVTARERLPEATDVPALAELGAGVEFVNWRGFFAPPGLEPERVEAWAELLEAMLATPEWEEVRRRNGWVEIFRAGSQFESFLEDQERELAKLMDGLGMRRADNS